MSWAGWILVVYFLASILIMHHAIEHPTPQAIQTKDFRRQVAQVGTVMNIGFVLLVIVTSVSH